LAKWKEEMQMDVQTIFSGELSQEAFDAEQWLRTKLVWINI